MNYNSPLKGENINLRLIYNANHLKQRYDTRLLGDYIMSILVTSPGVMQHFNARLSLVKSLWEKKPGFKLKALIMHLLVPNSSDKGKVFASYPTTILVSRDKLGYL